jgi:ubiquinol oxidase
MIQDINVAVVRSVKGLMDVFFDGRDYARFYALETIARVPYFAYTCVLHLYETLGWFRKAEYLRLHFAQDWNEYHHLKIAEYLGGNKELMDRLVAQSVSIIYFVLSTLLYMLSPAIAYNLSQQVEKFAYLSYDKFLKRREVELKCIPAPPVAVNYYGQSDPLAPVNASRIAAAKEAVLPGNDAAMAAHLQSGPPATLYDTFVRVRDDELDHAVTMRAMEGLIAKGDL